MSNPLESPILFHIGPVPIASVVVETLALNLVLIGSCWLLLRREGLPRTLLIALVETIHEQLAEVLHRDPTPFLPLLGTLFLFVLSANLSAALPGVEPATARLETAAALALVVFGAVHWYGIRVCGFKAYFRHYLEPTPLLLPLHLLAELTRTLSLTLRLFGNMMSHGFVIAVLLSLAALLVPVPFMLLGVLIGVIQAYIFTVLAAVYLAAALGEHGPDHPEPDAPSAPVEPRVPTP